MAKQHADRWRPHHALFEIARSPLLDDLTGSELVVYLRLVALSDRYGLAGRPVNRDLHKDASTASRALSSLAERGLIRVRTSTKGLRKVQVL